jgi:hypothetical protein
MSKIIEDSKEVIKDSKPKNSIEWEKGLLVIKTRSGKYFKLEEQTGKVFDKAVKVSTKKVRIGNTVTDELNEEMLEELLFIKSCVEPILKEGEFEINSLLASETITIKKALAELYDLNQNF